MKEKKRLTPATRKALADYAHCLNSLTMEGNEAFAANSKAAMAAMECDDMATFDSLNFLDRQMQMALGRVEAAYNEVMGLLGKH